MKTGLHRATIRVFEPGELAGVEKQRLLAALEAFVNLGDDLDEFLTFGRQNPNFFPLPIRDESRVSDTPLPAPSFEGKSLSAEGEKKIWTKAIAWEPVCHNLVLFYRDCLRNAWHPPDPGPFDIGTGEDFEILLNLLRGDEYAEHVGALQPILAAYKSAHITRNPILADWSSGSFIYNPHNDFQRAVYILFREGWRAKVCALCARRFIADKPLQRYCSTECTGKARRERNLAWWNKHGKKWRSKRKFSTRRKGEKVMKKRGR